jgi:hypothetical protein
MAGEESVPPLRPVIPLPIALYCSNGLLFELYDTEGTGLGELFSQTKPRLISDSMR